MTDTAQQTLTPAEIARVFALYTHTDTWHSTEWKEGFTGILSGSTVDFVKINGIQYGHLLLTPLERITDEDAVQVAKLCDPFKSLDRMPRSELTRWGKWRGDTSLKDMNFPHYLYQFLISRGYAVPLWFGVDHWANGKDAITLGIAVDKTQTHGI